MATYNADFSSPFSPSPPTGFTNRAGTWVGGFGNAYPTSPTNGSFSSVASFNTASATDDMEVSMTFGAYTGGAFELTHLLLGASTSGGGAVMSITAAGTMNLDPVTGWGPLSSGTWRNVSSTAPASGNVFTLRRVGSVYTMLKNGAIAGTPYDDSANTVPRGASNRYAALGGYNYLSSYRNITAFSLTEIASASFFAMFDS